MFCTLRFRVSSVTLSGRSFTSFLFVLRVIDSFLPVSRLSFLSYSSHPRMSCIFYSLNDFLDTFLIDSIFGFQGTKQLPRSCLKLPCNFKSHFATSSTALQLLKAVSQLFPLRIGNFFSLRNGLKWTRTTDLTLIRRAL